MLNSNAQKGFCDQGQAVTLKHAQHLATIKWHGHITFGLNKMRDGHKGDPLFSFTKGALIISRSKVHRVHTVVLKSTSISNVIELR